MNGNGFNKFLNHEIIGLRWLEIEGMPVSHALRSARACSSFETCSGPGMTSPPYGAPRPVLSAMECA